MNDNNIVHLKDFLHPREEPFFEGNLANMAGHITKPKMRSIDLTLNDLCGEQLMKICQRRQERLEDWFNRFKVSAWVFSEELDNILNDRE